MVVPGCVGQPFGQVEALRIFESPQDRRDRWLVAPDRYQTAEGRWRRCAAGALSVGPDPARELDTAGSATPSRAGLEVAGAAAAEAEPVQRLEPVAVAAWMRKEPVEELEICHRLLSEWASEVDGCHSGFVSKRNRSKKSIVRLLTLTTERPVGILQKCSIGRDSLHAQLSGTPLWFLFWRAFSCFRLLQLRRSATASLAACWEDSAALSMPIQIPDSATRPSSSVSPGSRNQGPQWDCDLGRSILATSLSTA